MSLNGEKKNFFFICTSSFEANTIFFLIFIVFVLIKEKKKNKNCNYFIKIQKNFFKPNKFCHFIFLFEALKNYLIYFLLTAGKNFFLNILF